MRERRFHRYLANRFPTHKKDCEMAKQPDERQGEKQSQPLDDGPTLNELAKNIVTDPDSIPDIVIVLGYLAAAGKDKPTFYRIYLDLYFHTYYEVLKTDVLHADASDPSNLEKPTKIFINKSAKLTLIQVVKASYLQGPIASTYPACLPKSPCLPTTTCVGCLHG